MGIIRLYWTQLNPKGTYIDGFIESPHESLFKIFFFLIMVLHFMKIIFLCIYFLLISYAELKSLQ